MTTAALDRLLAIFVVGQIATGLLSLRAGSPPTAPLFVVHGVLGGALLVAVGMKLGRSVPPAVRGRRWARLVLATLLAALTIGALAGGIAWVASGRLLAIGPWTVLTLHAWAALALVPVLAAHLAPRRWRVVRLPRAADARPISRRTLLATGGLAVAGVAIWGATNIADAVRGGVRRFTGSRWLPAGGIPPVTTFFGEGTPAIDATSWRLRVTGAVTSPLALTIDELAAAAQSDADAVLDCTSGWAIKTTWRGVSLGAVLARAGVTPGARTVTVRSVTGWYARLPIEEARRALLATHVAGQVLPAGNGAPLRLVVPDRRGLEWVKWVTAVELA